MSSSISVSPKKTLAGVRSGLYFYAILDLLGQGKALEGMESSLEQATRTDPDISHIQEPELFDNVYRAYAPVVALPQRIVDEFKLWNRTKGRSSTLSPADEERARTASDIVEPLVRLMGDAFHISAPLTARNALLVLVPAAIQIGKVVLEMFKGGIATRGAMDIGQAVEFNFGGPQLYGAVLARVHSLESKVAECPRVVVGDRLVHYALEHRRKGGSGPEEWVEPGASELLLSFLVQDTDQQWILDYIGEGFRKCHPRGSNAGKSKEDNVALAYRFIAAELSRQRDARDRKLVPRYGRLDNYFRSRAHLWPDAIPREH